MGIVAKLNQSRAVAIPLCVVVGFVAMFVSFHSTRRLTDGVVAPKLIANVFYTTDNGKTLFTDIDGKQTPFDHGGRPAVKAHLFTDGKIRWVQYLEMQDDSGGLLVRKPNDATWVPKTDPSAGRICQPATRGGQTPVPFAAPAG